MLCHDVFHNTNFKHEHIVMYLHFHANLHTEDSARTINRSLKFPALHTKGTCPNLHLPCVTVQLSCNTGHQVNHCSDTKKVFVEQVLEMSVMLKVSYCSLNTPLRTAHRLVVVTVSQIIYMI